MGAYEFRADSEPTADDQIAVERVVSGRLLRLRNSLGGLKAKATGDSTETSLSDWLASLKALTDVINATELGVVDQSTNAANIGAIAEQPASGSIAVSITRAGKFFTLDFTLTAAQIPVTDAAGSGSSGSLKLFDFAAGGITAISARQDYTAFAEGAALTGGAGDAAFVLGLGSAAADAGDGALTGTEVDFGAVTSTITLSEGAGAGGKFSATLAAIDGTATAADLYLNWSGTAATIDANSTIDVTGTITVVGCMMGDD
jgi:hypothetical protein